MDGNVKHACACVPRSAAVSIDGIFLYKVNHVCVCFASEPEVDLFLVDNADCRHLFASTNAYEGILPVGNLKEETGIDIAFVGV